MAEGINLERDTAAIIETGNAEQVIRGVLSGQGDAGFVRSDLIEAMIAQGKLSAGVLNVISPRTTPGYPYLHSTRLYPEWPFARVGDFPEDITKAVLIALLDMKPDDAAARQAHIHGWTLPQNYQPVLDLFREARFGPYARHEITGTTSSPATASACSAPRRPCCSCSSPPCGPPSAATACCTTTKPRCAWPAAFSPTPRKAS
jgi:hypothetical protein